MLIQLHKQSIDDPSITEFVAQNEFSETRLKSIEEVWAWADEKAKQNPLGDRQNWMICTEDYKSFVLNQKTT